MFVWRGRAMPRAPGGTSSVIAELAAVYAPSPTVTGATKVVSTLVWTSDLAGQIGTTPGKLILARLPHAVPELFALFLPLAAWMIASRRGAWQDLLAATAATTAMAVPLLVLAANLEIFVWPHLLRLASPAV